MTASLPNDTHLWGREPIETLSACREEICLNGAWHFTPARGENPAQYASGPQRWGTLRVPSAWVNAMLWDEPPELQLLALGDGPEFDGFDRSQPGTLLYRRTLAIPAAWAGRAIFFEMRRDVPTARVFVNGQDCGRMDWWNDAVEIGAACRPGETAELRLLVEEGSPLTGDAFLSCRPHGAHISDVFVQTSVRRAELRLTVELRGVEQAGQVTLLASLRPAGHPAGEPPERIFQDTLTIQALPEQTLTTAWAWPQPRLWDLENPDLYELHLEVDGGPHLTDAVTQIFGFREFWIEGRSFYLNGSEIRLRPVMGGHGDMPEWIDGQIDGFRWAGYNLLELWPRSKPLSNSHLWYECADRKGFLMTAPVGHIWDFLGDWHNPATRAAYERRTARELKRVRNHPSVVMWGTNGNVFGSGLGMDPRSLGIRRDAWYDSAYYRKFRAPAGDDMLAILKKHDPTRPVFTHHGGGVGDVYTLNMYLNLIPLQEREEWLSAWAQQGEMPFLVVEFGTPLHVTFMRGRTDFPGAVVTEPLVTEYCAIYLGREAYRLETPEYREAIRRMFKHDQVYENWHTNPLIDFAPTMQAVQAKFSRHTWRAWRTMGVTGGMIPWTDGHGWGPSEAAGEPVDLPPFQPGRRGSYSPQLPRLALDGLRPPATITYPAGQAIRENNGPLLAWICGPEANFTAKDHHFQAGQRVHKAIAILNDTRQAQEYSGSWQVLLNGEKLCCEQRLGILPPGKTGFLPVEFDLPTPLPTGRVQGELRFNLLINGQTLQDSFTFHAFQPGQPVRQIIHLVDPLGDTRAMLEQLGYTVQAWDGDASAPALVIGRCALSRGDDGLLRRLESYVRGGGRALICAQDPNWLSHRLGWRVAAHLARQVFPVQPGHPVLDGLSEANLRDWNGESSLVEARPTYTPGQTRLGKWWFPYHGYHWGNQGAVSSAIIEKPHRSGWRPILEGEFDLAYTPLMELDYGKGRLVWCSLDLEERVPADSPSHDPAATQLARQVMRSLLEAQPAPRLPVYLAGDDEDTAWLARLGLRFERTRSLPDAPALLVLGPSAPFDDAQLDRFLHDGGTLFCLPCSSAQAHLGVTLTNLDACSGSLEVPVWPETAGLSPSDLHWRTSAPAWVLSGGLEMGANGLLGRLRRGKGTALFCQLDPERFDADRQTYFRLTRWRQTRAVVQILANLGAQFEMDAAVFAPADRPRLPLAGDWQAVLLQTATSAEQSTPALNIPEGGWQSLDMPTPWEQAGAPWADSEQDILLRTAFDLPAGWAGHDLQLSLGKLDDCDLTFVNGVCVSEQEEKAPWPHNFPRVYRVPAGLLRPQSNQIHILVYDRERKYDRLWGGGLCGPREQLMLEPLQPGWYHPDYRADYVYGDDPYRYFNW